MITNAKELLAAALRLRPEWQSHEIQRESRVRPRADGEDHLFIVAHVPDASRACGFRGKFIPVTVPIAEEALAALLKE